MYHTFQQLLPCFEQVTVGITTQVILLGKSVPTARGDLNRVVKPVGNLYAVDGDLIDSSLFSNKSDIKVFYRHLNYSSCSVPAFL